MPSTSGSYSRLAGWLADEMWVEIEIFKILYKLSYSDCNNNAMLYSVRNPFQFKLCLF